MMGQELPKRVRRRAPMFLEPAEAKAFVATLPKPYDLAAETMLLTGMRPADMCGIRVGDIDFPRRRVIVTETVRIVSGRVVMGPTKTDKVRSIPLPASWACRGDRDARCRGRIVMRPSEQRDRFGIARRALTSARLGAPGTRAQPARR